MGPMSASAGPADRDDRADETAEAELSKLAVENLLSEFDTTEEELRVAQEELQAQQEEIDRLLSTQQSAPWWQGLLVSRLPVAVIISTPDGIVKSANAAACLLLGIAQPYLLGKPMPTYLGPTDRSRVRRALSEAARGSGSRTLTCTLQPRTGPTHQVQIVLSHDAETTAAIPAEKPGPAGEHVCWVLLPLADTSAPQHDSARIAESFARLAMLAQRSEHSRYVTEIADICQDVIGSAASVSINIGPPVEPDMLGADRKLAQRMDALQMQAGDGPCQQAWESGEIAVTDNLATETRWPELADLAAAESVASVLAIPVPVGGEPLGVINAYATEPDAFAGLDSHTGELLGSAVAAVIDQVKEHDRLTELAGQLEDALSSRAVIDQAKGIIIARYGCDPDEAFQRLVKVSRSKNVKVRELARMLVMRTQRPSTHPTRK
jgi:PAS domain-containing protein